MARTADAMITWNDMDDMVTLDGFQYQADAPALPSNMNKVATRPEVESYLVVYIISGSYADNQLVPYNKINRGLSTDPYSLNWTSVGSGKSLTIYTPNGWTASESVAWLSLSSTAGSGNTTITVTATTNISSQRSTNITITDTTTSQVLNVSVNQDSGSAVTQTIDLTVQEASSTDACNNYPDFAETVYIPIGQSWATCTAIYADEEGTTLFGSGWFSNGVVARNWNGSTFVGSNVNC